jgi:hypothetical protein
MSSTDEKRDALRLLAGLENGGMSGTDAAFLAEGLDPVLVYVIVKFLREVYPASDPAATSVLERVVDMTRHGGPAFRKSYAEGEKDSISRWFESEHAYGEFRGNGAHMIGIVVDKLES